MKKVFLVLISASLVGSAMAQQQKAKTPAKPAAKSTAAKPAAKSTVVMKNALDSVSYAIGLNVAQFYKQQGIDNINTTCVQKGMADALAGKPALTEDQMNMAVGMYMQKIRSKKAEANKAAGAAFLSANSKKPGVVTLPSGLQYQIITQGTGPKPSVSDKVKCHYHGTLIDGTVFDSSVERGQPVDFPVGGVIKGWVEALQLMPVGSKWKLFIPSDLAYGDRDAGQKIGAGSTLIFDVELLSIEKEEPAPAADSTMPKQ
ncbi:FKBP-type peptidyl-prolyl cis-trans isomerase [Pinibacter soli]|uniref:Peptidyl-prolyl cis-trans isomerase n=1 Tax=Pinibacter soli TaxID=3044211 RepID=A0ABT6RGV3_9BACT|nr:FKBP-type peptidyl-prolyl cis-trans isomerase [Pinibacter soli]MDI3321798.1 FKBP-type peptidyl-prolyl cis-trans isomerase [Pinibacter soli]